MLADLARAIATAARLADAGTRVADGIGRGNDYLTDAAALDDLADLADALTPGAGQAVRATRTDLERLRDAAPRVVEGQFRVVDRGGPGREPWLPFVAHVHRQRAGAYIVVGQTGQGKTTFARHLAGVISRSAGVPIEYCNLHLDDVRPGDTRIRMERLIMRMGRLALSQRGAEESDDPEDTDAEDGYMHPALLGAYDAYGVESFATLLRAFGGRVVVIDEGSSAVTSQPNDPARWATRMAIWHGRHIDLTAILLAQMLNPWPQEALAQATLVAKQPGGRELDTDRDNRTAREFWLRAMEAFAALERSPWYQYVPDRRAWAYVDSPPAGSWPGWSGMVPFGASPAPAPTPVHLTAHATDREGAA